MFPLLKISWREIVNQKRFTLFFVLNLILAMTGLLSLETTKQSVDQTLKNQSKSLLAADFAIGARRYFTDSELEIIKKSTGEITEKSDVIETFSMVSSSTNSKLVEVRAIEGNYPFYGTLRLKNGGIQTSKTEKDLSDNTKVWVYPELLMQLDLNIGDQMQIGQSKFQISDVILEDSSSGGGSFSFALPIYISQEGLKRSELLQTGSTFYFSRLFKYNNSHAAELEEELVRDLSKNLSDPAIRVTTSENASQQVGRILRYVGDYLALAALVALFLSALGQFYLFKGFVKRNILNMGIYRCLGLTDFKITVIYLLEIFYLNILGFVPACILVALISKSVKPYLESALSVSIQMGLDFTLLIQAFFLFFIGSLFVCGPMIKNSLDRTTKSLFSPDFLQYDSLRSNRLVLYIPAISSFLLLSFWFSKSFKTGILFFGLFSLAIGTLCGVAYVLISLLPKIKTTSLLLKLSTRQLKRNKWGTVSIFVTYGLAITLASLIPNLESSIKNDILAPANNQPPSLFIFDIQEEQISQVKELFSEANITPLKVSPMIRARLSKVNEKAFEKVDRNTKAFTREEEDENRFRNRGFNLSYQNDLSASEKIVEGQLFEIDGDTSQISLESRFADRLGLKIGDLLTFDIQGVEVSGKVKNIRKIQWTSFLPNFFIVFNEGPLNDAPKTYLLSTPPLTEGEKVSLQNSLARRFPNISTIDVSQVVNRLTKIISQVSIALQIMAYFTIFVGLLILTSMTSYQVFERRYEFNLLKVLGSTPRFTRNLMILESSLVIFFASILGIFLGLGLCEVLVRVVFDTSSTFSWGAIFTALGASLLSSVAVNWIAAKTVNESSPLILLRASLDRI